MSDDKKHPWLWFACLCGQSGMWRWLTVTLGSQDNSSSRGHVRLPFFTNSLVYGHELGVPPFGCSKDAGVEHAVAFGSSRRCVVCMHLGTALT